MSSHKEITDTTGDRAHEACGWRKFTNANISSDDSDDGGIKVVAHKYSEDDSLETKQNDDMIDEKILQGVVIVSLSDIMTGDEVIKSIIDNNNKDRSPQKTDNNNNLTLDNKYFETNIQLLDYTTYFEKNNAENNSSQPFRQMQLKDCHAVVIYTDYKQIDFDQLNKAKLSVNQVQGEPRILACGTFDESDENSRKFSSILEWCVENEYEFIPNVFELHLENEQEGGFKRFLDALSAYRWPHLKMKQAKDSVMNSSKQSKTHHQNGASVSSDKVLNSDIMKKIEDFDELLTKLNQFRGRLRITI